MNEELPKATREQAKRVWDEMKKPSARKVADALAAAGYQVSFRTIVRWQKKDFRDDRVLKVPDLQARANRKINAEIGKVMDGQPIEEANKIAAAGGLQASIEGQALTEDDFSRIEKRRLALLAMTDDERHAALTKAREVMNIILMEEAARKGHVMTLMPKETGALVEAMTDAAKSTLIVEEPIGVTSPLNGHGNGKLIEHEPANPLTSAIDKYLADVA